MQQVVITAPSTDPNSGTALAAAISDACRYTGFIPQVEIEHRTIYDADDAWYVRIRGRHQDRPAILRVENFPLAIHEVAIRSAFLSQALGMNVRPPRSFAEICLYPERGWFACSIDEDITATPLFTNDACPTTAARAFADFYRDLRDATPYPFWSPDEPLTRSIAFTHEQVSRWAREAVKRHPAHVERLRPHLARLQDQLFQRLEGDRPLRFVHAHLTGTDILENTDVIEGRAKGARYIVMANNMWSWRQPARDIVFPIWHQWLSLSPERRNADEVRRITENWLAMAQLQLVPRGLVEMRDLGAMLFERIYGALLIDLPGKRRTEPEAAVDALEQALIAESVRLESRKL